MQEKDTLEDFTNGFENPFESMQDVNPFENLEEIGMFKDLDFDLLPKAKRTRK